MDLAILASAGLTGYWVLEWLLHKRCRDRIPLVIHVNGSRGKSSVTRLIAGALRGGGYRVVAKTTGTAPRLIRPDGAEEEIVRAGPAALREQTWVVERAVDFGAEILVVECMAIDPMLQRVSQDRFIQAPLSVITNVRSDHLEEMGPDLESCARSLSAVMPSGGVTFTTERELLGLLQEEAGRRRTHLVPVCAEDVTAEELSGFSYLEHSENAALALAVSSHLGVPRSRAIDAMYGVLPDPGVLRMYRVPWQGKLVSFFNAFAANDPQSTAMILDRWVCRTDGPESAREVAVVLNTRRDRLERSSDLLHALSQRPPLGRLILVGDCLPGVRGLAARLGFEDGRVVPIPKNGTPIGPDILNAIAEVSTVGAGIGNIGGVGEEIVEYIAGRAA